MKTEAKKPPKPKPTGKPYDPCPFCGGHVDEERDESSEVVAVFCTNCDDYYFDYK